MREVGGLSLLCTTLGGEEIAALLQVEPEQTLRMLLARIEQEVPAAPSGCEWSCVLGGKMVDAAHLDLTVSEYFRLRLPRSGSRSRSRR